MVEENDPPTRGYNFAGCSSHCFSAKAFFIDKERPIKPLTLKEVATEINVHESTVSRAVNGKYLETDFGVFELKKFFTARIPTNGAEQTEDLSADTAKKKLQELVDQEDKSKPLSDQKLVELLKKMR